MTASVSTAPTSGWSLVRMSSLHWILVAVVVA